MRRTLEIFVLLFGLTCIAISLVHIAIGPSAIPGSVPVNATMDSEDRFYATLFLGFGVALAWCSRKLEARRTVFGWLMLLFFLGGVARVISALQVGMPNTFFQVMGALELILPPLLWWWHRKVMGPILPRD